MPVGYTHDRRGDARAPGHYKFYPHFGYITLTDTMVDYIMEQRKQAIADRELWLVRQKEAGKAGDRELAKFCKEEAAEAMKWYRAACLLFGLVGPTPLPGDCLTRDPYKWAPELWPYLTHLENTTTTQE